MPSRRARGLSTGPQERPRRALLDTHFVLWIALGSSRVEEFPWLYLYHPWTVSPVSMLEIQLLAEIGRIEVESRELAARIAGDGRFLLDEVPLSTLVHYAFDLTWTRDPFDRLLAAHSAARRLPLCTVDRKLQTHHRLLTPELAA